MGAAGAWISLLARPEERESGRSGGESSTLRTERRIYRGYGQDDMDRTVSLTLEERGEREGGGEGRILGQVDQIDGLVTGLLVVLLLGRLWPVSSLVRIDHSVSLSTHLWCQ